MKYIFTLGISFKKYKKPLDITIRSKYLIDHLQITDNIEALDPWPWNPNAKIETLVYNIFDQVNGKHPLNQLPEKMFFMK